MRNFIYIYINKYKSWHNLRDRQYVGVCSHTSATRSALKASRSFSSISHLSNHPPISTYPSPPQRLLSLSLSHIKRHAPRSSCPSWLGSTLPPSSPASSSCAFLVRPPQTTHCRTSAHRTSPSCSPARTTLVAARKSQRATAAAR